jgi:leader peptidase (prepilin peptidase)/N-methyltransferase
MGWGDVKLAGLLGACLGYAGWPALVVGGAAAFVLGGVVGVVLLATGRVQRRGRLAFGPFMVAGAVLGAAGGSAVAAWYLGVAGLAPA